MICCEKCDEWYHGDCVGINQKKSKTIKNYYCDACIGRDPSLSIVYKTRRAPIEKKSSTVNQNSQDRAEEKRNTEKKQITTKQQLQQQNQQQNSKKVVGKPPKKVPNKIKAGPKAKSRNYHRKQCVNPECLFEARLESNYCSDECGITFNRMRYEKFFLPNWKYLEKKHSLARAERLSDWGALKEEREVVIQRINNLKIEKEELEKTIQQIKEEAKKKCDLSPKGQSKTNEENDDEDFDVEDNEEILSGDAGKTFCITCGNTVVYHQALKHWSSCHKKHEDIYNYSSDIIIRNEFKETDDPYPKLYCNHQDKKTKRYCMNIEGACPLHSSWNCGKDEVCGCPLNIMQKLTPDGNYCTEFKKHCTQHYHWDRFRLAQLNMQRVQAFGRLDVINERVKSLETIIEDSYGGVVGIMLHRTIDHEVDI